MKKIIVALTLLFISASTQAQFANTRWKATLQIDNPINVIMDFGNDTVRLYTVSDSTIIETMAYRVQDTALVLQKIEGQSECESSTIGKYKFDLKDNRLVIRLISDDCDDRVTVIDNSKWVRWKNHPEVKLNDAVLQRYVGTYEFDSLHPVIITLENGCLYAEGPNNNLPKSPLAAESELTFFLRIAGVEFDFVKDARGSVTGLISHEAQDYLLKKVK
jgi:hypothetical protein